VLEESLIDELLSEVKSVKPVFFEKLVVGLLMKMGYGDWSPESGEVVGKPGDGGIDGIINEDKLGLDKVFVQAKRWGNTVVGTPTVKEFAGALDGVKATKGVLITTSTFSKDASNYVEKINKHISLIDGYKMVRLMIELDLGVSVKQVYKIKKIDRDYFLEE